MKKIGLLVLSVILTSSLLVGCGSKKAGTNKDTAQTTTTQQTQKDTTAQTDKDNSTTSQTPATSTSTDSKVQVAKPGTTPILDKLLQEEKEVKGSTNTDFIKTHPTETLIDYINFSGKYDINKNWPLTDTKTEDYTTKVSDKKIIYHVPVLDPNNNVLENRDMTVEFKNGAWSVVSDVVVK